MISTPDTEQNDPVLDYMYHPGDSFCPEQNTSFDADTYIDRLMQRRREILARGVAARYFSPENICRRLRGAALCCRRKVSFFKQTAEVRLLKSIEARRLR
jgi:hypothetical protein